TVRELAGRRDQRQLPTWWPASIESSIPATNPKMTRIDRTVIARPRTSTAVARRTVATQASPFSVGFHCSFRSVWVSVKRIRDIGDRSLCPDAVAGCIKRRRDRGDAELAG